MKIKTKEFKEACQTILKAIDTKEVSLYNETLELKTIGTTLFLNVTNREYYVRVKFDLGYEENFHASINSTTFLRLMDKITTEEIEITTDETHVKVKGNGEYKLPLIYNNEVMLELPTIEINNVTNTMDISSDILQSISFNNSKELLRGKVDKKDDNKKYYYIDQLGCITSVFGACVNSFTLPSDVKMLLSDKVVKLLRLFKDSGNVKFTMGQDPLSETMIQTKVRFETDTVSITAKMPSQGLFETIPVEAIRAMASKTYPYSVVLDKNQLSEILNRLILFTQEKNYGYFTFDNEKVVIADASKDNKETLYLSSECPTLESYELIINLDNFMKVIDGCIDDYFTMSFGDDRSILIKKGNISDLLTQIKVVS